ncbi:MAG: hypothetical protein K8T89_14220 [Planctomycetes bacterium]|nr:hypothetical protein [Planctomycetota bacterium]
MPSVSIRANSKTLVTRVVISLSVLTAGLLAWFSISASQGDVNPAKSGEERVAVSAVWRKDHDLKTGETVEISVRIDRPASLPVNGRIAVEWQAPKGAPAAASWRKVLHALDADVYLVYRAPIDGEYSLRLVPVDDEDPVGSASPRWREKGNAPNLVPLPKKTPWPQGVAEAMTVRVTPLASDAKDETAARSILEREPNDIPDLAQTIELTPGKGDEVRTWEILGGADELEFFDNGKVGQASVDDWYWLEYKGTGPSMLTAQLSMPNPMIAHRIRFYRLDPAAKKTPDIASNLLVAEYRDGADSNERVHQQDEPHRANINRTLKPGETYFLRVEANAPGYQLQLRLLKPAPYEDPRLAIRQGMYTQIGQVDAWLTNRPRGASVDRRIRDTGNLLGTNCMSCHTQSGVWGPAVPLLHGYNLENVQNFWHLRNVMYECLRPTNELKDAANNTSLAPLDTGDGPAGTRAAGFNIVNAERVLPPLKLHSAMQTRTANFVLQTGDPGGINAAGPGSNVGQVVVYVFSSEILQTAWQKSNDPKYFRMLEDKARKVLAVKPQFTDDVALRLDYFHRLFPIGKFEAELRKAAEVDKKPVNAMTVAQFITDVKKQLAEDEARLVKLQNEDGSWGFSPEIGPADAKGKPKGVSDPAPTALAITALTSAGRSKTDPVVAKGVQALLKMQDPSGRWNRAAQTGFVTSAYALHALSRLYPALQQEPRGEKEVRSSLANTIAELRQVALHGGEKNIKHLFEAGKHASPAVRYWAMIGLGALHAEAGLPILKAGLSDSVKMVRDGAVWGLRQTLLDDKGWDLVYEIAAKGDDYARESLMIALNMRADAVLSGSRVDWAKLGQLLDRAMNDDPHPAVRAWASKAAWQWWVWNPPIRTAVNAAWVRLLEGTETNALAENCKRYSSQALFIANGHKANSSGQHQYKELATLFSTLSDRLDTAEPAARNRLVRRLVGISSTFYATSGGDGGPGQMGYSTPGAGLLFGKAVLAYLEPAAGQQDLAAVRIGLEAASSVPDRDLTDFVLNYSLKGPESLRDIAANAISDPRSVKLAAVPELVEPQLAQVQRGALEPPRRPQVSDPILRLWSKVNWVIPATEEQQRNFFTLLIPKFDNYQSREAIATIADPARRAEAEKQMNAAWYLADSMGDVMATNPDLHHDLVFRRYFPAKTSNPLEAHFWIRSVGWVLTHTAKTPAKIKQPTPTNPELPAEDLTIKDRALQLYLDQLRPEANPATRALAVRMANQTALRRNPEVLLALGKVAQFEKSEELKKAAANVLKQGTEKFVPELLDLLRKEKDPSIRFAADGTPQPAQAQIDDMLYFRDYVMPELVRQKREDSRSCLACHGVPGKVPSLTLRPADEFGYMATSDLLTNYRLLQKRVDLANLPKSKLLRKPLNVEDGQEDGHQGGRRYSPMDEGYLQLKRWVDNQPQVQRVVK